MSAYAQSVRKAGGYRCTTPRPQRTQDCEHDRPLRQADAEAAA
jgi:hypothetical protein